MIVGVNNITVSQIDDTIFIGNNVNIGLGTTSSFAIYGTDSDTSIDSTGQYCTWNKRENRLEVTGIKTDEIYSDNITATYVKTETTRSRRVISTDIILDGYFHSPKVSVGGWIGFKSKSDDSRHCFRLQVTADKSGVDMLRIISSTNTPETEIIRLEGGRTSMLTTLNLKSRTIKSSIGEIGDKKGDVSIDENYLFYCTKNFNGVLKIWKRVELSSW